MSTAWKDPVTADWTPYKPPLDLYPNAYGAFSFRKLRTAYTGPCCRIRFSTPITGYPVNYEDYFYFNEMGLVDLREIKRICGAGNAFLTIWYDQSASNTNALQLNTTYQPKIISSGISNIVNGQLGFACTQHWMDYTWGDIPQPFSVHFTASYDTSPSANSRYFYGKTAAGNDAWSYLLLTSGNGHASAPAIVNNALNSETGLSVNQCLYNNADSGVWVKNHRLSTTNLSAFPTFPCNGWRIGTRFDAVDGFVGTMHEFILLDGANMDARRKLFNNMHNFHNQRFFEIT